MALPALCAFGFLIGVTRSGSDIAITFEADLGATYRLERKLNLTTPDTTFQFAPAVLTIQEAAGAVAVLAERVDAVEADASRWSS